jgi:hypothetical protein
VVLKVSKFIAKDLVYKQNPDSTYILNSEGELVRENINDITDAFLDILNTIYKNLTAIHHINHGRIKCNTQLLNQALTRYSRDIFGEMRLDAKIKHFKKTGILTEKQIANLSRYFDYGFKTDSRKPYIHRQLSNLLYWLSVLKPFAIYTDDKNIVLPHGVAFEFHNEYISYMLALALLKTFNRTLTVHKKKEFFYDFLYDLHYRNLSRSSIEFFLYAFIKVVKPPTQ